MTLLTRLGRAAAAAALVLAVTAPAPAQELDDLAQLREDLSTAEWLQYTQIAVRRP